jgi:tetratricopeptide (TPR) repeat protein
MKRNLLYLIISLAFTIGVKAQDVNYLLTEAAKLEKEMKDPEALKKYQEALQLSPTDVKALTKCSELNSLIGNRQTDKKTKQEYFNAAKTFAETALKVSDQDADANYTMALALAKYSASGSVKERMDAVKEIKKYADKALVADPEHYKTLHLLGRWNFEVTGYNVAEKAALKVAFGGLPSTSYAAAIELMEKSRKKNPNYLVNYLDLAKAYKSNGQSDKAIEILNRLIKLPPKTPDDEGYKSEGKKLLESLL